MHARTASIAARCLVAAATIAMAIPITFFAGDALAGDHEVTVAIPVSTRGLDLSQSDGAQKFYTRLENAADDACTSGYRVDLAPPDNAKRCYEQALAGAVRSANVAVVTQIYLQTHTVREALAYGVSVPAQVAAK